MLTKQHPLGKITSKETLGRYIMNNDVRNTAKTAYLKKALLASLIAGIIIEALLVGIYIYGVETIFSTIPVIGLLALIALAFYVYYALVKYTGGDRIIKNVAPIGIFLGILGVLVGITIKNPFYGGSLIVAAYYTELFVGGSLRKKLLSIAPKAINVFVGGVIIFILSLPLTLIDNQYVLIPIIGNFIKIGGLTSVVLRANQ